MAGLPQPVGRQKEVLVLPACGHHVVLGSAGSGKTTLAIHRSVYLANPNTEHYGCTLLVTFNRCLVAYLKSLAAEFLHNVVVENYHRFARGYLNSVGKISYDCICGPDMMNSLCSQAVKKATPPGVTSGVLSRPTEVLVEEFKWLAQHGITTSDEYVAAERIGRAGTRIVRADRPAVFDVYERYRNLRSAVGKRYDWYDLSHSVLAEFGDDTTDRRYKHIVIDEGQDLSPMEIRSLAAAIPADGSLTFFGDMAQQIYGNKISWRDAGLSISGVWEFEENYRNTQQVARLALALAEMPAFPDVADLVTPKAPTADGPPPVLASFTSAADEEKFVTDLAKRFGETNTVAVLFRDRKQVRDFESRLGGQGTRLRRDLNQWPSDSGIFYGTYHSAKGLEFDAVILPHLSDGHLPYPSDVAVFGEDDTAARDSRLLYVGITRAKSNLVLTYTGKMTKLLPCDETLYQRKTQ